MVARRAHTNDGNIAQFLDLLPRPQTACLHSRLNQLIQSRLDQRTLPAVDQGHLVAVRINAGDLVAQLGQTGGGHTANVPQAKDMDFHNLQSSRTQLPRSSPLSKTKDQGTVDNFHPEEFITVSDHCVKSLAGRGLHAVTHLTVKRPYQWRVLSRSVQIFSRVLGAPTFSTAGDRAAVG